MSSINRDYLIFPLSCDPALEETEEREIYYKYLDSAFDEPRIHNIGIAGGFGVGKSSLLRSYEKDICEWRSLSRKLITLLKTGVKRMNRTFFTFPWEKANAMTVIIRMRQSGGFFADIFSISQKRHSVQQF